MEFDHRQYLSEDLKSPQVNPRGGRSLFHSPVGSKGQPFRSRASAVCENICACALPHDIGGNLESRNDANAITKRKGKGKLTQSALTRASRSRSRVRSSAFAQALRTGRTECEAEGEDVSRTATVR